MSGVARFLLIALCIAAGLSTSASADNYPTKPVRILVGFGAGGSVDLLTRLIGEKLSKRLGQQFYVENRPGAGTVIATTALTQASPDGYTLMMADIALSAAPALVKQLPYDTLHDLVPIVRVASLPSVLAVSSSNPAHTLREFVNLAKSEPGKFNYGSAGVGSFLFLAGELFKSQAGINIEQIPYKSTAEVMLGLARRDVSLVIAAAPAMMSQRDKLRFLAVSNPTRLDSIPDVPTFAESGMPDFNVQNWQGLVAPKGTDPKIIARINKEMNEILNEPEMRERLSNLGMVVLGGTQMEFQEFLASEMKRWSKVIKGSISSGK